MDTAYISFTKRARGYNPRIVSYRVISGDVMHVRRPAFFPIVLSLLCLALHAEDVPEAYKVLNGNWLLTSTTDDPSSEPMSTEYGPMTFTLGIDGSHIYGEGTLEMHCPKDRMGFDVFVDGQISPDGTFILLNSQIGTALPAGSVVIKGTLPGRGAIQWPGQFSSDLKGRNGSCVPVMGEIVASQLPVLKGIFLGTVQAQDGLKSDVTMEIAQGDLITTDVHVPGFSHCVPLNVTMTIKNATGPLWGTFSKTGDENRKRCNRMAGENLILDFTTTDGATLNVSGRLRQDKLLASGIALQIHYLPKDFPKTEILPVHAIGELKRQSTTQTGANLIR
jgi:hypothetical protein